jgi:polyferredoxin
MARKRKTYKTHWLVWLRRAVQSVFLVFFLWLFLNTTFFPINTTRGPVKFFFQIDPLVALNSWIASHTFVRAMSLSLVTLVATFLFGRWFCGWICPFGTVHNFFTSLRGGRTKQRLEVGGYSPWQRIRYLMLTAFVGAALLGSNVVGWLDPFSFFFRSLATAVYPALNAGTVALFTWIYDANPGIGPARLTSISEPIYAQLRQHLLAVAQPYYTGGVLIGVVFVVVIALNFFRARFWCRYICPLGALLGVVGKNPLVRLHVDTSQCNNCRVCLVNCQGGANPQKAAAWMPSECFFCANCISDCPWNYVSLTTILSRNKVEEKAHVETTV